MSFAFNQVLSFFKSCARYRLRWPRPRTVGSGHGRSRRRHPWGTFARVRAHGRYSIGGAMLPSLFLRGVPPRAPRLKAPSTRTRAKSCAIIAALGDICGLASMHLFWRKHAILSQPDRVGAQPSARHRRRGGGADRALRLVAPLRIGIGLRRCCCSPLEASHAHSYGVDGLLRHATAALRLRDDTDIRLR